MNQLKTKIEEVKTKLGLTQMQLSERIGKNPYYLDTVKHRGVTTERQLELIRELDLVANGGTVMTERGIIAELTEKADALQSRLNSAQAANKELCLKLELAESQHRQLEGMYDSNWDELQKIKNKFENIDFMRMVLETDVEDLQSMNSDLRVRIEGAEHEYDDLNDAYGRACEKLADMRARVESLQEYKRQYRALVATVLVIGIIVILGFVIWSMV